MNIFADFNGRINKTVETLDLKGQDGARLDLSRISVEPPRDASHGDLATNAAMVLAKPTGQNPRALAEKIAEALRSDPDVAGGRSGRPGLRQSADRRRLLACRACRHPRCRPGLRALADRRRPQGQCRICLGQSDRADACRPLPRRGGRRCARQPARLRRLRGHQGILHQRRRRADRRAGPLGDAALPRGAGRQDRRDPGRALPRRLSRARRRRRWPRSSAGACCRGRRTRRSTSSRTAPSRQ